MGTLRFLRGLFSRKSMDRKAMAENTSVMLPLYIYPSPGAWQPLYDALKKFPLIEFVVIVNPHNGPGGPSPDTEYTRELTRLAQFPNARTVGYARTDYCRRSVQDVFQDIETYASWPRELRPSGIFFDETPNLDSEDGKVGRYLARIAERVKGSEGIRGDRLVINNPGTVPAVGLGSAAIDLWVVCEDSHTRWRSEEVREWMGTCRFQWEQCCYMVHSIPESECEGLAKELGGRGKYLFVTDLTESEGVYSGWGKSWMKFVEALDAGA